ncbi:hypothetical protein [Streptomyces malaysiense]|uniref:Uncharacterized protein n=1 Tax=Streptomyces malaysiense TaxID=1428626 RepID=A0A1J4PVU4_9ACTN|nr:hypothetical protein [Streptomyces malaysiense]OIK24873.1 hypothetical protein VT52_025105 [Streptomyces malaysiense]
MAALAALRADVSPLTAKHPAHVFRPLPKMLGRWEADGIDTGPFHAGVEIAGRRYAGYGLTKLLPFDRVLIGCESSRPGAFGGFHHPDQGYQHLRMAAVITMYGPLEGRSPERPALALLDLLRAYAHDCLHHGSRRRYVEVAGTPVRTQYGIDHHRVNGGPYPAAGPRGVRILMEGACDREARSVTRRVAEHLAVAQPTDVLGALAYRDATGTLTAEDADRAAAAPGSGERTRYMTALADYEHGVNRRYARFLEEFAPGAEDECHTRLLGAVISGDASALRTWLDDRHGPGTFAGLFRAPAHGEPDPAP